MTPTVAEQGFNTRHKPTTMWKTSRGLSHWEPITVQPHQNPRLMISKRLCILAKVWNSFHLLGRKLGYPHLKDSLKYECELYLKRPSTPPQWQIQKAYRTPNHRLTIENWTMVDHIYLSLEIIYYTTHAPTMQLKTRHILWWNVPYVNPTRDKYSSLFENVSLGSLKSSYFFSTGPSSWH